MGRPEDESLAVTVLELIDVENSWYDAMSEKTLKMVVAEYGRTLVVVRWRWAGGPPSSEVVILQQNWTGDLCGFDFWGVLFTSHEFRRIITSVLRDMECPLSRHTFPGRDGGCMCTIHHLCDTDDVNTQQF